MILKHFQILGKKANQEDAYFYSQDHSLFVVCDGVGGRNGGEVASRTIVENIRKQYVSIADKKIDLTLINDMIRSAIEDLNEISTEQDTLDGMSTTLALLYVSNGRAYTAHIGDSRIRKLNQSNKEIWSTKDHSIVQELFDAGVLNSESDMQKHPYRNRITKAIVANNTKLSDVVFDEIPTIDNNDIFIVCSDGLLEHYTNNSLLDAFAKRDFEDVFFDMKMTCEKNSRDNSTVIIYKP